MKSKFAILSVALLLLMWTSTHAADYEIYIGNHPFSGESVTIDDKLFVELVPLARGLGIELTDTNGSMVIGKLPATVQSGKCYLNGKTFLSAAKTKQGVWFVRLRDFVEAVGGDYTVNETTNIIDIFPGANSLSNSFTNSKNQATEQTPKTQDTPLPTETDSMPAVDHSLMESFEKSGVALKYPKYWVRTEGGNEENVQILAHFFPDKKGTEIVIRQEHYVSGARFGTLPEIEKMQLKTLAMLPRFQLVSSTPLTLGGISGHAEIFTMLHVPTGHTLKGAWFWNARGAEYGKSTFDTLIDTVEYIATVEDFPKYLPEVTAMLNTMTFKLVPTQFGPTTTPKKK